MLKDLPEVLSTHKKSFEGDGEFNQAYVTDLSDLEKLLSSFESDLQTWHDNAEN
jgi:hypothetical protein